MERVLSVGGHTPALTTYINTNYSDIFPETSGVVRGVSSAGSGWLATAEKHADTGLPTGDTILKYVIHADLKGWMPAAILNATVGGTYIDFVTAVRASMSDKGVPKAAKR